MKNIILILAIMASTFSELDGSILRDTSNPPLIDKGSELTYAEFDGNFVKQYNAIQSIVDGSNVTAYDPAATYDQYSTDVYEQYCGYGSRIWKATYNGSPSSFTGQTPAEGSYWTQVSLAQLLPNIMALSELAYETNARRGVCPAYCAKVTITSAQVLQLNSTPIEIVPAPGAGKAIDIISATAKLTYNSIPYATNTVLMVLNTSSTQQQLSLAGASPFLASSSSKIGKFFGTNFGNTLNQIVENEAIVVSVATGNPTAGDSDIVVYVYYHILDL